MQYIKGIKHTASPSRKGRTERNGWMGMNELMTEKKESTK
jgi:hypothetical protein